MGYVDVVKDRVLDLAGKAVKHSTRNGAVNPQTVTIDCSVDQARQLWCDPRQLSVVLGDIADVKRNSNGDYRWEIRQGAAAGNAWVSKATIDEDGVRFTGLADGDGKSIAVELRTAPYDLGTEVTLRVEAAGSAFISGAIAYAVLYRARALLQTGEVPTLAFNPSARRSAR
jgi:uncharacterized membrane protein